MKIRQKIIYRKSTVVDVGAEGFHDYVTKFESFEDFVKNVEHEASFIVDPDLGIEIININYPTEHIAVIVYIYKQGGK